MFYFIFKIFAFFIVKFIGKFQVENHSAKLLRVTFL